MEDPIINSQPESLFEGFAAQTSNNRQRTIRTTLMACFVCVATVLVLYFLFGRHTPSWTSPEVLTRLGSQVYEMAQHISREPCNVRVTQQLANMLLDEAEYSSLLGLLHAHLAQCGANNALLPMIFAAQMGLGDIVKAEETADQIIINNPAAPDAFGWRAEVREKRGNISGAYTDMQKALSLFPDPSGVAAQVYYDTGRLAVQSGHPCEGVAALRDYIAYDFHERKTQQLTTLMNGWQTKGACPDLSATGSGTIRYDPHGRAISVPVEVNGVLAE